MKKKTILIKVLLKFVPEGPTNKSVLRQQSITWTNDDIVLHSHQVLHGHNGLNESKYLYHRETEAAVLI